MHSLKPIATTILVACSLAGHTQVPQAAEKITIDATASTTPFPHFWEKTFGSERALVSLRESYRDDLRTVKTATNFESVRFHGIFMDEVGLYDPGREVKIPGVSEKINDPDVYNFNYINQIYDGLLANHVKPFVELSFMPRKLASKQDTMEAVWYHPNVSPPKDYEAWDAMIVAFADHLVRRYGIDEVATWKFEVWNEPNFDFWDGAPKQSTYFALYDHTARALKTVSPRLQVGGPATAQAAWITPFLEHVKAINVPIDFVSTHVYANDSTEAVFHVSERIPRDQVVYRAAKMVHDQILASPYPALPLIFSEYNVSYANEPNITDSPYMGPWLASTISQCDGLTESMAYWDFSDVFEEGGVVRTPFYGGYGLMAANSIPKPSLNIFAALHKLGGRRLAVASTSAIATTTGHGLAIALWNYAPPRGTGSTYTMPTGPAGPDKTFNLDIRNFPAFASVEVWRIDDNHSNVLKAFDAMGRPPHDLTLDQITKLRAACAMSPAEHVHLSHGDLKLTVPAQGLAVLLVQ
jgi:xylan 1,4-beta-xylosidase